MQVLPVKTFACGDYFVDNFKVPRDEDTAAESSNKIFRKFGYPGRFR